MSGDLCTFLVWDTEFFGCRIARVNDHTLDERRGAQIAAWCEAHAIDCLYFLASSDDPATQHYAAHQGYLLQDIRVVLDWTPSPEDLYPQDTQIHIRQAEAADLSALLPIAHDAYTQSRFYSDPRFSREKCAQLYEIWLERSIRREIADAIFVAEHQSQPAAFVTCKILPDGKGEIGLVGVSEAARGRGYGQHLLATAQAYFRGQGVQRVEVATQGRNIGAQRLYQRCGFRTASVWLWYHQWLTSCQTL